LSSAFDERCTSGENLGETEQVNLDTRAAAREWASTWSRAWADHDAAAITALYADGAVFQPHPFRPPLPVQTYLDEVFADEVSAEPFFDEPVVDGVRAAVHWRARTQLTSGASEDLSGVALLVFDAAARVVEHRDYWMDGASGASPTQ
jgi:ketosteroid isomerase-like protein